MSKWRPVPINCLYVIPDINGRFKCLKQITARILPLRKSGEGKDKLVFLGNYLGSDPDSHLVLDLCLKIQKKHPQYVSFLLGQQEDQLLQLINQHPLKKSGNLSSLYKTWLYQGGYQILHGYLERNQREVDVMNFPRERLEGLIPEEHVKFMQSCQYYTSIDAYTFAHASIDLQTPLETTDPEVFISNSLLHNNLKNNPSLLQDKILITGSHPEGFISSQYMSLNDKQGLVVMELQSMESRLALKTKNKLFEHQFPVIE